jgi:uncharacterized membrane protein
MYLLLKALHISALMTWIGGMLLQVFLLRTMARQSPRHLVDAPGLLAVAVRWDRRLTAPAMLVAWACGLALASKGGWLGAPWLSVKLALVVALSALHGFQAGWLRRLAGEQARSLPRLLAHSGVASAVVVAAIVLLVVIKP